MVKAYVQNITIEPRGQKNPQLLRVVMHEEYTRIDFGYHTYELYENGGWVKISPETYLEDTSSGRQFKLTNTRNIPISPERHNFKSQKDWLFFSLFFEPIPFKDSIINMIECENKNYSSFNYYDIEIDTKQAHRMVQRINF